LLFSLVMLLILPMGRLSQADSKLQLNSLRLKDYRGSLLVEVIVRVCQELICFVWISKKVDRDLILVILDTVERAPTLLLRRLVFILLESPSWSMVMRCSPSMSSIQKVTAIANKA